MKPSDVYVSSYELPSIDDKYGRLPDELNGQTPGHTHLPPKSLRQYRWISWTNGLTIFSALCLCGACIGGIVFVLATSGQKGGVYTYDSLCGASEVTTFAINMMIFQNLTFQQVKVSTLAFGPSMSWMIDVIIFGPSSFCRPGD